MSSLTVFAREINNLANTIQKNDLALVKEVTEEVVSFVATATPIDTGQASGNWKTSIGVPDLSVTLGAASPGISIQAAKGALLGLRAGQPVHITNNLPYITLLNQGTSKQAPSAFVEMSVMIAMNYIGRYNLLVK